MAREEYGGVLEAVSSGGKFEPWVIAPNMMSISMYVRRRILNKENSHLWDCPTDQRVQKNDDRLGSLWKYLSMTSTGIIMEAEME